MGFQYLPSKGTIRHSVICQSCYYDQPLVTTFSTNRELGVPSKPHYRHLGHVIGPVGFLAGFLHLLVWTLRSTIEPRSDLCQRHDVFLLRCLHQHYESRCRAKYTLSETITPELRHCQHSGFIEACSRHIDGMFDALGVGEGDAAGTGGHDFQYRRRQGEQSCWIIACTAKP